MITSHKYVLSCAKSMIPSMRYDFSEDFSLWQERASKKLEELLGLPFEKPVNDCFTIEKCDIKDELTFIHFTIETEEGYTLPCCLVKQTALKEKTPLVVCLMGHSTGMHIALGQAIYDGDEESIQGGRDFAVRAAREGKIALALEQRYMGTLGYEDKPMPSCNACYGDSDANQAMATLLLGRCAIGERVWDVMRALDAVLEHFADMIDEGKIACMGNSGGGTATFYAACLDKRITLAVPSCAVCDFEDSIMTMNHCPCNFVPGIRKYFDMGDLGALIAPRNLVVVCGIEDSIFPIHGVRSSYGLIENVYKHIGREDACNLVTGDGGHRFYPDEAWPVMKKYI